MGTSSGVTVTHLANQLGTHVVTGIQVSGDAACIVTIESPASTVLWRSRQTGAFDRSFSFPLGTMFGADGGAVLVKISASTSNCEANIQGVTVDVGLYPLLAAGAINPDG